MATLTVWKFPDADGADRGVTTLELFQREGLITVHDAAVVSWQSGAKRPKTRELNDLSGSWALGGTFWGLLFGVIFFVPLLGASIGAAVGALAGSMRDIGIDDDFIYGVRDLVTPGTSALFVISSDAVLHKVRHVFADEKAELIETNLDSAQEAMLVKVFAE
jgi:uncharacterized membrane protein